MHVAIIMNGTWRKGPTGAASPRPQVMSRARPPCGLPWWPDLTADHFERALSMYTTHAGRERQRSRRCPSNVSLTAAMLG
jgi:hypothetical protein